jgi:hypothetical protein
LIIEFTKRMFFRIDLLDEDECYVNDPQETPQEPGDGDGIGNPNLSSYELDCHLDSFLYYPDSRLYITDPTGQQHLVHSCDLSLNSSGCSQVQSALTDQLVILGDAPAQNLTVLVSPNSTIIPHFGFYITTGNVYAANITAPMANWSLYNITDILTGNCTDSTPLPWPDPLPPFMCDEEDGHAFFRDYDGQNLLFFGEVWFHNDDNVDEIVDPGETITRLTCDVDTIPLYTCLVNVPYYNGEEMGIGDNTVFYELPVLSSTCFDSSELPNNVVCRYNTLWYNPNPPSHAYMFPIVTDNNRDLRIPCEMIRPTQYACTVNGTGPAEAYNGTAVNPLVYLYNASAEWAAVPCIQNPITAIPLCTQVNITYDNGQEVRLEFEGTTVRFYIDDKRQDLRCAATNVIDSGLSVSALSQVQQYYELQMGETNSFESIVQQTTARVEKELKPKTTTISTVQQFVRVASNHTGLFRKLNLVCCSSEFLRSLGEFVISFAFEWIETARSLLSLPAGIPGYVFQVPTFADALEKLRDAGCKLACALTRIFGDLYSCGDIAGVIGCQYGSTCASGLLCNGFSVVLLLASIVVELLTTIREIVNGEQPSSSPILGDSCSPNNVADCFSSFIVYVITKIARTVTQVFRDLAANLVLFFQFVLLFN